MLPAQTLLALFCSMKFDTAVERFRHIARWEGISYLLLLFVAMPLKYGIDWPYAVKYLGWAHGVLFVAYGITLLHAWTAQKWSFTTAFLAGLMSLLPFGTFWFEKKYL